MSFNYEAIQNNVKLAHKHSYNNAEEILNGELCGCYFCLKIYTPNLIVDWIVEDHSESMLDSLAINDTAICPKCGVDSVIGVAPEYPITKEFLKKMKSEWFDMHN